MLIEYLYENHNPPTGLANASLYLLKPGYDENLVDHVDDMVSQARLVTVQRVAVTLSRVAAAGLYANSILRPTPSDTQFGLRWKHQVLDYMSSGPSYVGLVEGDDAFNRVRAIRAATRSEAGVVSTPDWPMGPQEFFTRCIKNIMHQPETDELVPAAWVIDEAVCKEAARL